MTISERRRCEEQGDNSSSHGSTNMYRGPWTKEMDVIMVKTLNHQASKGIRLDGRGTNSHISCAIINDLKQEMNAYASHSDVLYRLSWHKKNGDTIRRIIAKPGFSWSSEEKRIIADKETWSQELEFHPLYHLFTYSTFPVHDHIMSLLPDEIAVSNITVKSPSCNCH